MEATKHTSNTIYWLLILLAVVLGLIIYVFLADQFSLKFLLFFSGVPFLLFASGFFGILWPKVKPEGEEMYISHALIIGFLFMVLFFIHVWVILPYICPEFGEVLGK